MKLEQLDNLIKWGLTDIIWPLGPRQPNLEELLEFADRKLQGIILFRKKDWEVTVNSFEFRPTMSDPDPKQAIYKLLEKIMGEAPTKQ